MFLSDFTLEEQKIYLNLAYTLLWADGNYRDEEKEIFCKYQTEVLADITKAQKVDFKSEIDKLRSINSIKKREIFIELLALAMADREYASEEKKLLDIAETGLSISKQDVKRLTDAINSLIVSVEEIKKAVKGVN